MRIATILSMVLALDASSGVAQQQWTVVDTMTIGSLNDPDYILTRIEGIALNAQGHVFVLQHEEATIKEYDAKGQFVRRIGRRGSGPGEFVLPGRLWFEHGKLAVWDPSAARISEFDASGTFIVASSTPTLLQNVHRLNDGSLIGHRRFLPDELVSRGASLPLLRASGSKIDSIGRLDLRTSITWIANEAIQRRTTSRNPFSHADLLVVAKGRREAIVVQRRVDRGSGLLRLAWLNANGDTIRVKDMRLAALPMPKTLRDSVVESFALSALRTGLASSRTAARTFVLRELRVPAWLPLTTEVIVGEDGSIWLRRGRTEVGNQWIVLDSVGNLAASVNLPSGIRLYAADRGAVWGVRQDGFDVPTVVRLKVAHGITGRGGRGPN